VIFWLTTSTGLRQGEIFALKWHDLDWKLKRLHV